MEFKRMKKTKNKDKTLTYEYKIRYKNEVFTLLETKYISPVGKISSIYLILNDTFDDITFSDLGKYLKEQFVFETS